MLSCLCFLSLGVLWGIHFLGHESAVRPILQGPGYGILTCLHVPLIVHRSGQCRISYV